MSRPDWKRTERAGRLGGQRMPALKPPEARNPDAVLEQARDLASTLDPPRAAIYRSMPPARWLQAINLGSTLLTAHAAYRLHHARGRGRRQHAAETHTLLDEANGANLIAALALMLVMGRMLDPVPRGT
jgi:hypothetical protein